MGKVGLVIVDVQRDTLRLLPGMRKVKERAKEVLKFARQRRMPVIYLRDAHLPGDKELRWLPRHCLAGSKGGEIAEGLEPEPEERIVTKREQNGFSNELFEATLRQLALQEIWLVGDPCVVRNAEVALEKGFKVSIVKDAVYAPFAYGKKMERLAERGLSLLTVSGLVGSEQAD